MPSIAPSQVAVRPANHPDCPALGLTLSEGDEALLAELSTTPQTIGAGPRCSIRLEGPGIRPMHCVVTPTDEGPVVRRWAAETLLNNEDFAESRLELGDRLLIGTIELTVVQLGSDEEEEEETVPESSHPVADLDDAESSTVPAEPVNDAPIAVVGVSDEAPEPVTSVNDKWFDAGIESIADHLEEITSDPSAEESPAIDPAIPSHLLQPWVSSSSDVEALPDAERETADAVVPLDPVVPTPADNEPGTDELADGELDHAEPAKIVELIEAANAAPDTEATDLEWSVPTPAEKPEAEVAAPIAGDLIEEPSDNSADAWAAEFTADPAEEPLTASVTPEYETPAESFQSLSSFDLAESQPSAEIGEPEAQDSETASIVEAPAPVESTEAADPLAHEAFQAATAQVAQLRDRLRSNRQRVASLVAALKQRREEIATLESAVGDRDQLISELQGHLQDALEVGEAARAELAAWQESAEAAPEDEPATEAVVAALNPQVEAELALAQAEAEQIAADIAATAPTDPGVESIEAFYEQQAEEPFAPTLSDPQPEPEAEWEPEANLETEEDATEEGLWGIEQLPSGEPEAEVAAEAAEAAPLWDEPTVADEPVEGLETSEAATDYDADNAIEPTEEEVPAEPQSATTDDDSDSDAPVELISEFVETSEPAGAEEPAEQEEEKVEIAELIAKAAAKTAFDPLANTEPAPHEAPQSFIEQYAHTLPGDDEPAGEPTAVESIAELTPEPLAEEPTGEGEGEDDSIDDYMRKLMERVRGEASPAAPAPSPKVASTTPTPAAATADHEQVAEQPEPAPEATAPIRCLSEMKRGPVRQSTTDMGALRQLANQSARHAIDVAATRDNREQATLRLVAAAVALGCGGLAVITASDLFGLQFVGGIAGMVAGGWFGFKTLKSCQLASRVEEVAAAAQSQPQD